MMMNVTTPVSDRIVFQLMIDALGTVAGQVLGDEGTSKLEPSSMRIALTEIGLLTCPGSGTTPTKRGWRVISSWWEQDEGEEPAPGSICGAADFSEAASYMATGKYRVVGDNVVERVRPVMSGRSGGEQSVIDLAVDGRPDELEAPDKDGPKE